MEFIEKCFIPNSVKRLGDVQKNDLEIAVELQRFVLAIGDRDKIRSRSLLTKFVLVVIYYSVDHNTIENKGFKDFLLSISK